MHLCLSVERRGRVGGGRERGRGRMHVSESYEV